MTHPTDNIDVKRLKLLLLGASLVSIVFLLLAAFEENLTGDWRQHQQQYRRALIDGATTDGAREAALQWSVGIKQLYLSDMGRIDRCVTCHVGIDDPSQVGAPQPLGTHPPLEADAFTHHPIEKFGCTVCHDGQGLAIHERDAHGEAGNWPAPLLRDQLVYTSCSRCHYENDLYGVDDDLYARSASRTPLGQAELEATLPGADAIARGKHLVAKSGCLGCHQYRGRGGKLGPDITYVGDKTVHDFDFKYLNEGYTVEAWLFEHFKNPERVSPNTMMPDMGLSDGEAHDLTQYMLSLRRKQMPAQFTPVPPRRADEPISGAQLYAMFCASCHGPTGQGSTVRVSNTQQAIDAPPQLMVPSLNHPDTLGVASDDYLRSIVNHGREGTNMIGWLSAAEVTGGAGGAGGASGGGNLRRDEIERLVAFMRSWEPVAADINQISEQRGSVGAGRVLFGAACASCHGRQGEGGIGPSLNSPSFLAIASDRYLAQTIIDGRPNTAMSSYRSLSAQQISDLVALLRSWHPVRSSGDASVALVAAADDDNVSVRIGATLYQNSCVTCHGDKGQGDLGPSLNAPEFLSIVNDRYLYDAIVKGRTDAGMPAWRHMKDADVASLIKYLRTWQSGLAVTLSNEPVGGDAESGKLVFDRSCASCHGADGRGAVGTQLANPVFLRSASDAMLKRWINYGKTGTAMRGFARGQQGVVELSEYQVNNVVVYLRSLEAMPLPRVNDVPQGRPELGKLWYANACASCHGLEGQGGSGPSLSNGAFLRAASDGFLMATLAMGREGTEMRPVTKGSDSILALSSDQVDDVVAFMRSWEHEPPLFDTGSIPHRFVVPWDLKRGRQLYVSNCAGCHGDDGKPELAEQAGLRQGVSSWAPQLNNPQFLQAATDGYLQATIVRGRIGTAMRPFGHGSQGLVDLTMEQIDDIVAYIRQWATVPGSTSPMTIPAEVAQAETKPQPAIAGD